MSDAARRLRLDSGIASVRAGARWELWIEARLGAVEATLERHPHVPGMTRRPDLAARVDAGPMVYVEATATGGGSLVGHRQPSPRERLHDVVMSRLKHKSRAFQGIDGPLVVAVLCVADIPGQGLAEDVSAELFAAGNERGRNVSSILLGWDIDHAGRPSKVRWMAHPDALHPAPGWAATAFE